MSSSTSSSDAARWRRFLATYCAVVFGLGLAAVSLLVAFDPYDTGRFAVFGDGKVAKTGPRLANASRGRNPAFDSAVIGNSHSQILSPERLGQAVGGNFVSLSIPGTGPKEQFQVAQWFVRHHGEQMGALVFGVDQAWCHSQALTFQSNPFPDWLYAPSAVDYLRGLMQTSSFEATGKKIAVMLGKGEAARADGFDDYEANRVWSLSEMRRIAKTQAPSLAPAVARATPRDMPAAGALARFVDALPTRTVVVAVFPPVHASVLPAPETEAAAALAACKQAVAAVAAARPGRLAVVDYLHDGELAGAEENFWDGTHYRSTVARLIEADIATAIRRLRAGAI